MPSHGLGVPAYAGRRSVAAPEGVQLGEQQGAAEGAALDDGRGALMRTFELSTRITAISRSEGRSATSAAAYRACCAIHCEREGRTHDYHRKRGLEVSSIVLPNAAPAWASSRSKLWNAAELRERNGARGPNAGQFKTDAKVAREFMFAFPTELSQAGRLAVATLVARHLVETHGIAADFSIHQPGKDGDERNFHCHMLTTTRRMTADGLTEKAREWDALKSGATLSKQFRAFLAATMNDALAEEGQGGIVHVEHRSFKARGGSQRPQKHLGPNRTNAIRREQREARQAAKSEQTRAQQARHSAERAALAARQAGALERKLADLVEREQRGVAVLTATRKAEPTQTQTTGLRRLWQGLSARETGASDNAEPALPIERQAAALRLELQAEHAAYVASQTRERQTLDERHAAENRQLATAATHRVAQDRLREQQARRAPEIEHHHAQEQGRDHASQATR